jgi:asparagine synthase (glutamine-hydrolysing)
MIFTGVRKSMPGEIVSFDSNGRLMRRTYWSLVNVAERAAAAPLDISNAEAIDQLDKLVRDAGAGQRISDVPLGFFLVAGRKSYAAVVLTKAANKRPVPTFSIRFPEFGCNEPKHAAAMTTCLVAIPATSMGRRLQFASGFCG